MLNNITWAGYLYALTFLLLVYYSIILLLYYRSGLLKLLNVKSYYLIFRQSLAENSKGVAGTTNGQTNLFNSNASTSSLESKSEDHTIHILQTALDELKAYFNQAAQKEIIREELLYALQRIVRKYPMLSSDPLQLSINNHITSQCKNNCSIHLSAEEVSGLWKV